MNTTGGVTGYDLILDSVDRGGVLKLAKRPYSEIKSDPVTVSLDKVYNLKVEAVGGSFNCYLDGVLMFTGSDSTYHSGQFGIFGFNGTLQFDNLRAVAQ
ncbi:hypothetical protein A8709_32675 [Paenibacillus pectinilyticus]|uniref:3-keto-disaccharide hydrolase domain-containing protein n=1 Tax=Paenibacillus pectinilyticus TaxID=512399 RepID=A0A1C0ZWT5_9BACL|nr:hypothetical protein [Paenibacillus pectinilyticus]OCT12572.1 hypothetical protein A8709_32675 [Paenibacillus pectinilyticus]